MSVEIDLTPRGDRIVLRSSFATPGLSGIVAGASFSKTGGPHWTMPLSLRACYALRERFGEKMRVGIALADWARDAIDTTERLRDLGAATDAALVRIPHVSPPLAGAMGSRTYQRSGARFMAESIRLHGGVLNSDQPGLGKTLETIGAIIESGLTGPFLVVCPKTAVEPVWSREIPRWWPGQRVITLPDGRAKRDEILDEFVAWPSQTNWVVVHPEIMRVKSFWRCEECSVETKYKAGPKKLDCDHVPFLGKRIDEANFPQMFVPRWGAIVVDESSRALLRRTGTPNLVRNGMEMVRDANLEAPRIAMDGTPFRSRPRYLWGTLNWLLPKIYPSAWRFYEEFFEVSNGYGSSRTVGDLREDAEQALDDALSPIMIRRTKEEVAPDLPAKTYGGTPLDAADEFSPVAVWLPMAGRQKAAYDQMQLVAAADLEGGELTAMGVLAERTRLKQFAIAHGWVEGDDFYPSTPSNKFDWILQKMLEMGFPDNPTGKLIIASQFTSVLRVFHDELLIAMEKEAKRDRWVSGASPLFCGLTGAVTGKRRTAAVDTFNMDLGTESPHVMFIQTKTGGVAITIDSADDMVIVDETDTPDDQEQLEDRIHRVSKPRPVTYWYLKSLDSIDEGVARANAEKRRQSHLVLDGRRGVEYRRGIK